VAVSCEYDDEPVGFGATDLICKASGDEHGLDLTS
jgi:hypothetical protein